MKNVVLFIIDSLNFTRLKESNFKLMPYLTELSKNGISCTNMYSQSPYTEAAVMDIYCGQNVLDNKGYLKRFKHAKKTIFEVMKNNGYTTYYNSYQPQCFPSTLRRGIDYIYYNVGYDLGALWSYRLYHYKNLMEQNDLDDIDKSDLVEIFEDNFAEWKLFAENLLHHDSSCSLIAGNAKTYDEVKVLSSLIEEYKIFKQDELSYIYEVLEKGMGHRIYQISPYNQDFKISEREVMKEVATLFNPLLKHIRKIDVTHNLKNNKGFFKGVSKKFVDFVKNPSKESYKNFLKSAYVAVNVLTDLDLYKRTASNYDYFKNAPSARTHIDHYIKWLTKHKEKPHFACIHVDDIHNPEVFFTYDTTNMDLLQEEFKLAKQYVDSIQSDYKGSITHDLSLRYIDTVIKYLIDQIKSNGTYDDTMICITADHGFSFSGYPLRDSFVTNLYLENYRVPFVIVNSGKDAISVDHICMTKDIPSTICELALGKEISDFSGKSILAKEGYRTAFIEYCGGGCPDLRRRQLKLASFDFNYFVGSLCTLAEPFDWDKVTEVYDLKKDPYQLHNIVKNVNKNVIMQYFCEIKKRHDILKKENFAKI